MGCMGIGLPSGIAAHTGAPISPVGTGKTGCTGTFSALVAASFLATLACFLAAFSSLSSRHSCTHEPHGEKTERSKGEGRERGSSPHWGGVAHEFLWQAAPAGPRGGRPAWQPPPMPSPRKNLAASAASSRQAARTWRSRAACGLRPFLLEHVEVACLVVRRLEPHDPVAPAGNVRAHQSVVHAGGDERDLWGRSQSSD